VADLAEGTCRKGRERQFNPFLNPGKEEKMMKLSIVTALVLAITLIPAFTCSGQSQTGVGPLGVYDGNASFLGYLVDGGAGGPTYVVFNPDIPAFFKVSAVWPNPLIKACEGWSYYFKSEDCGGQPYIAVGESGCGLHYLAFDSYADAFYIYDPQVPIASISDFKSAKLVTSFYNCTSFNYSSGLSGAAAFPIKQIDVPLLDQPLHYPIFLADITGPLPPVVPPYTLSINLNPHAGGSVTVTPQKSSYGANEVVTLTATPNAGYIFGSWSGDATGTTASIQVTMTENMVVTATFASIPAYTLSINLNPFPGGYVIATPQKSWYSANEVVALTATCYAGYAFSSWSGDATGTNASIQITMTKNMMVTANFTTGLTYALSVSLNPTGGGTVTVDPQKSSYSPNDVVTLTANPNSGYAFSNWSGDATGTTASTQITMTKPMVVTAAFVSVPTYPLSITLNPSAGGSVTVTPQKSSYNANDVVTLTANANGGYTFGNWSGDANGTTPSIEITMTKPMAVTANFDPIKHTLTVIMSPPYYANVTLSPAGGSYSAGTQVTISVKSNSAFHSFSSWSGDATGTVTGTSNPITITMPNSNITVTANLR